MRRAYLIAVLLVEILSFLSLAQTTLTVTGTLPFDLDGVGAVSLEGSWQWQRAPWTAGTNLTVTARGFESAKVNLSYQVSTLQASGSAQLTPEGLSMAETQFKTELFGIFSLENTLSFGRRGFKTGKIAAKLGSSALNVTGSAQLTPEGVAAPRGALNFSLSQEYGDLSGTTNFTLHGFKEQTLSAIGYLSDAWTLTMNSRLTPKGFESETFELAVTMWDGLASLSLSMTVESQGITSEGLSLDLTLDRVFVQASLDFSGLELSGFQLMANGFIESFAIDAFLMGSMDGVQFATLSTSGELLGFNISASLDISIFGLDNLSLSVSRSLGRWTFSAESAFGSEGFRGGALKARYSFKFP